MVPTLSDDSTDVVRIVGRTICIVSIIVGVFVALASGMERGAAETIWHIGPIGAGIAMILSGFFMWALLRGIAQIRDRMEILVEELEDDG